MIYISLILLLLTSILCVNTTVHALEDSKVSKGAMTKLERYRQKKIKETKARDILLLDPYMSALYQKGPYLVYDCKSLHWVCTALPEFKRCRSDRKYYMNKGRKNIGCAPIKKFEKRIDCLKNQTRLTDVSMENRFCINDDLRKIETQH